MHLIKEFILLIGLFEMCMSSGKECPRDKSRVVAQLIREKMLPVFHQYSVPVDHKCRLSVDRDMYSVQEDNKRIETSVKYTCDFCGKAFLAEYYLDAHFDRRHSDQMQTSNSLCLADVCDVLRCDIVSGASTPDYWDVALCMEDDMKDLYDQCEYLVDECIPRKLSRNATQSVKGAVMENICSFLTCMKYWNTPVKQEEQNQIAFYSVMITMVSFGIIIYNFVFYNYFYSDLSDVTYQPPIQQKDLKAYRAKHKRRDNKYQA